MYNTLKITSASTTGVDFSASTAWRAVLPASSTGPGLIGGHHDYRRSRHYQALRRRRLPRPITSRQSIFLDQRCLRREGCRRVHAQHAAHRTEKTDRGSEGNHGMTHKLANKNYDLQAMPTWPKIMHTSRAETGPMSFGDDWPGVFIRGDNAMMHAMKLRLLM